MPKRRGIAKRQRPQVVKPRLPAVLKNEKKDNANNIIGVAVSVGDRELKFARALADTEERVRSASLTSLRAWLKDNASNLDDTQIDRLWKALFYCIWMADKRAIISAVIRDIVGLFDILGWVHLRGLFRCMVREWMGVDRHRIDKFYELLNVALEMSAASVVASSIDDEMRTKIGNLVSCVSDVLLKNNRKDGKGILMHVLDKWVEVVLVPILEKASSFSENAVHWAWDHLLDIFYPILKSPDGRLSVVKLRLEEQVVQQLPSVAMLDTTKVPIRARHDMLNRSSKAVFAAASVPAISEDDRKRLYALRTAIRAVMIQLKSENASPTTDEKPQ